MLASIALIYNSLYVKVRFLRNMQNTFDLSFQQPSKTNSRFHIRSQRWYSLFTIKLKNQAGLKHTVTVVSAAIQDSPYFPTGGKVRGQDNVYSRNDRSDGNSQKRITYRNYSLIPGRGRLCDKVPKEVLFSRRQTPSPQRNSLWLAYEMSSLMRT